MTSDPKRPKEQTAFDLDAIKQLLQLMEEHDLSELAIEECERKVHLKRGQVQGFAQLPLQPMAQAAVAAGIDRDGEGAGGKPPYQEITSPMVGTFYRAPSPETPAYIEIGAVVEPDTVVCIVEAMKVMNEIKAGVRGTITEVLVENGHVVEFGEPLFRVSDRGA
ncbi:MAG: acetyl-CoA carboxylase biotin carboxyl carrier protein [Verrucomicrobiota bacterium]|jgi:acetyl-CoA carboxylase biotin carboxyl carrier protein|nr:acetyl-CoA carboxylase biotin carboxyl carrier protein [Verrucomicrobiota bacterium]MDD8047525.1 acetyl-CoA carboxylase biotin carboxyl carrier protein [Verrucomicrobiota bacterium]MDI9385909.1 acetyl-CoA carboxylase biotin carboxyl carrier protein [Verrucomicrobiota bacterium]